MKKIIYILLSLLILIPNYINAETINSTGSYSKNVILKRYSNYFEVEVLWSKMNFIYKKENKYYWNNQTHDYDLLASNHWEENGNEITVNNKSDYDVKVTFEYKSKDNSIIGSFDKNNIKILKHSSLKTKLFLNGNYNLNNNYTVIGRILITIT